MSWERAISRALLLGSALVLSIRSEARAQTSDKAVAEALFQDGRELLAKGSVSAACLKFAASQSVEPKLGTLLNLAACHETEGRTASAWAEFTEAIARATRAGQTERATFASEHAAALEKRLSRLTVRAPAGAVGLEIVIDGVHLRAIGVETAIPVDPGDHTIGAEAPGKHAWSRRITVAAGATSVSIAIPLLDDAPPPTSKSEPPAPEAKVARHADSIAAHASPIRRAAAFAALTIGITATGIGTYNGVRAFGKKADGDADCNGAACSQAGLNLFADAKTSATVSTVAFGIGIVGVAIGVYLLATSHEASRSEIGRRASRASW